MATTSGGTDVARVAVAGIDFGGRLLPGEADTSMRGLDMGATYRD